MAAEGLFISERWIREKLQLQNECLADVRSLRLPGAYEHGKIGNLGISLKNFVRLRSLDLSHNALASVEGIVHLRLLEKLSLYYNRISSLRDVLALRRLQHLKELDLRLNPVVTSDPRYRLYLVHGISTLRTLDDCPVRDRERKAALMHFSVDPEVESGQKAPSNKEEKKNRRGGPRIAAVNRLMMSKLSLRDGNEEAALNQRSEPDRRSSAFPPPPECEALEGHRRVQKGCPLTPGGCSGVQEARSRSMELLLGLVEEHWSGKEEHDSKHFFTHAVRILCTMEREVSDGEARLELLRGKNTKLNRLARRREEEHRSEVREVTEELQRAQSTIGRLDEELRSVLEENVSLQKQLIRLEQQLLSEKLKEMPSSTGPSSGRLDPSPRNP